MSGRAATPGGSTAPVDIVQLRDATAGSDTDGSDTAGPDPRDEGPDLGRPGRPLDRRNPFYIGMVGAAGVAVTYVLFRGMAQVASVLVIVGTSLFIAVGLSPVIEVLMRHRLSRGAAVTVVVAGFLAVAAAIVVVAVPPITHEFHVLVTNYPRYRSDLIAGRGWAGRLAVRFHLTGYLTGRKQLQLPVAGGILGAGKMLLSVGVATTSVIALTVYFLIALPGVKRLWLSLIVRSRRRRVALLTDEVFERVGGFMLGNLLTSVVSAVGTYVWLVAFGVPYALLLPWWSRCSTSSPWSGRRSPGYWCHWWR